VILFITGTTGIAAATAERARAAKHEVFAAGLPETDLTDPEAAERAVSLCVERHGRIDALLNAAGASGRSRGDGPLHECSEEGWRFTLDVNLGCLFHVTRAVLRRMLEQVPGEDGIRGSILNMSSVLATSPEPRHFATHAYAAAKGAVDALTVSLAAFYAPFGIRVNAIAPGLVRTPMTRRAQADPAILEQMKTRQPLAGGLLQASDIAGAALFLLGPESGRITGQVLAVDGGWTVS